MLQFLLFHIFDMQRVEVKNSTPQKAI